MGQQISFAGFQLFRFDSFLFSFYATSVENFTLLLHSTSFTDFYVLVFFGFFGCSFASHCSTLRFFEFFLLTRYCMIFTQKMKALLTASQHLNAIIADLQVRLGEGEKNESSQVITLRNASNPIGMALRCIDTIIKELETNSSFLDVTNNLSFIFYL
jgi:hypothetical protein